MKNKKIDAEKEYEKERQFSICMQELRLAEMSLLSRKLLDGGYSGHGRKNYEWQASQLIGHLENAAYHAAKLPLY